MTRSTGSHGSSTVPRRVTRPGGSISGWLTASSASALLVLAWPAPCASAEQAGEGRGTVSLCEAGEEVIFSCALGSKNASLCAARAAGAIGRLTYRYGSETRIEASYAAEPGNGNRFKVTAAPANPRALVRQVWFDRGPVRTLLSECIGGGCARPAALSVLRGDKIVRNSGCARVPGARPFFSHELADFGPSGKPTSKTELLAVEEADNMLEKLY